MKVGAFSSFGFAFLTVTGALALAACLAGCFYGDRGYPPTSSPNHIPSPPRYVRIVEWLRPDYFTAEYQWWKGRVYDDKFVIITRGETTIPLDEGWYAPHWSRMGVLPELNPDELATRDAMEKLWPPGSVIELEYPVALAAGKDKKIGRSDEVRLDRGLVQIYNGYIVTIKGIAPESVAIPPMDQHD